MKKVFTFVMGLALAMTSVSALAETTVVTTKGQFTAAVAKERAADGVDTIIVRSTDGAPISVGSIKSDAGLTCEKGTLYIIGENDSLGNRPAVMIDWQFGDNEEADNFSLIIENMNLQYRSGAEATSGQIFYCNKKVVFFQNFILRNCEITNYARTIIRTVPTDADATTGEIKYGAFNHFEISDCDIHYANISSVNTWACIVMGSPMIECVIRGNVFYDLPYNKQIMSMSYINFEYANVENTAVVIENNIFATATQQTNPLFAFDNFLGEMSTFSVKNNIFMRPDWENDLNLSVPLDEEGNVKNGTIIRLSKGLPVITNNIASDFYREATRGWVGDMKLDEDGEGAWYCTESDTVAPILPEAAGFTWSDFAAAESGDFSIYKGHAIATMGADGAPMGPERLYVDEQKVKVAFTVSIEGSKSAKVQFSPDKKQYFAGDVVQVSADTNGDLNEFLGWSDGSMELAREITLTEDLNLVARFKEINYIAVWNAEEIAAKSVSYDAPLAANYAAAADTYYLGYRTTTDGVAYADSTTKAIQTRNNKLSTDIIRYCYLIRSSLYQLDTLKATDYLYTEIPEGVKATTVYCYVGTDNYCSNIVNLDYSTDGTTWVNFGKATIAEGGKWYRLEGEIPADVVGKHIYVRIQGDANAERVMLPELVDLIEIGEATLTWEFICVADIHIMGDSDTAIERIEADKAAGAKDAAIYDIMGRRVLNTEAGRLYIQNGKKFIQK